MSFEIVDITDILDNNMFTEQKFLDSVNNHNWGKYQDKKVLVRGCASRIIPPWAYMIISVKLFPVVKSIRFGNEHDNIIVYRNKIKE
ncbi:DUF2480 family protein [Candidatus Zixiibacteriota bacterium]